VENSGLRPMTDEEAKQFIEKYCGGYAEYRKSSFKDPPPSTPVPVKKSAAEVSGEYYIALAKGQNLTLEEFFKRHPDEYERYRELARVYVGAH
jgi:hypothetical protein